jgi:hypothetical protein
LESGKGVICWLATVWNQEMRVTFTEELRTEGFRRITGDSNRPASTPRWWRGEEVTASRTAGAIAVFLVVMVVAIPPGTVIGGLFLRAACGFYNKQASGKGSPDSVPEPLLGKAMGIAFVTTLVNAVAGLVIGLLLGAGGAAAGASERGTTLMSQLLSLPVSLLVMAGLNSALLPTTFARGLLVALCYLLMVFFVGLVGLVLAVICGGLLFAASLLR